MVSDLMVRKGEEPITKNQRCGTRTYYYVGQEPLIEIMLRVF